MVECPQCLGEGEVEHPTMNVRHASIVDETPPDPLMVECEACGGKGAIEVEE